MNSKGLTLIEVMVVVGSLALVTFIMISEVVRWSQMTGSYDSRDRMMRVFLENVAEIKATDIEALPDMGLCFWRRYSLLGDWQEDSAVTVRPPEGCVRPSEEGIVIVWDLTPAGEFSVDFDDPDLLKIPEHREALKEIVVTGYINDPEFKGGSARPFTVTLYRR